MAFVLSTLFLQHNHKLSQVIALLEEPNQNHQARFQRLTHWRAWLSGRVCSEAGCPLSHNADNLHYCLYCGLLGAVYLWIDETQVSHFSSWPSRLCSWECFCTSAPSAPLSWVLGLQVCTPVPAYALLGWSQAFPHAGQALYWLSYIPSLGQCFKCWDMKGSIVILSYEEGMVSWLESAERGVPESSLQWADGNRIKLRGFLPKKVYF